MPTKKYTLSRLGDVTKIKMSCPVCYDQPPTCQLVCGHSFCYQCVGTWYQKGTETCPMCRASMCFHGMRETKNRWDAERREGVLEEFVEYLMGDLEESEYLMDVLEFVYERYNTMLRVCPDIDHEVLSIILRNPYFKIDVRRVRVEDDVPTYKRYLMVPKTAWGVMNF